MILREGSRGWCDENVAVDGGAGGGGAGAAGGRKVGVEGHGVPAADAVALLRAGHALVEALAVLLEAGRLAALAPGLVHHGVVFLSEDRFGSGFLFVCAVGGGWRGAGGG